MMSVARCGWIGRLAVVATIAAAMAAPAGWAEADTSSTDQTPIVSFSPAPAYIYEGWTVTLTAFVSDPDAGQVLTAAFSQTGGQPVVLGTASTPNTPPAAWTLPFTAAQLTSAANQTLTFSLTATDSASPPMTSPSSTVSIHEYLMGDINHDNCVNVGDLQALVAAWNLQGSGLAADLNNDTNVNIGDLQFLVANWNRSIVSTAVPANKYCTGQVHLLQAIPDDAATRLPGGSSFSWSSWGPTGTYVNAETGWMWDNFLGDYLDANQTRQGTSQWFQVNANRASGNVPYQYTVDITSALQFIQTHNRWCAFILRKGGAPRSIASTHNTTYPAPVINVTHTDNSTATLFCWVLSGMDGGASSTQDSPTASLPAVVEFDRPTKAVQSATMTFTVTYHYSGNPQTINGFVADPTVNSAPVQQGIATIYDNYDANITNDANVIGCHRYMDGTTLSDFRQTTGSPTQDNVYAERNFDPYIWDATKAHDYTKYPHRGLGKWIIGSDDPDHWSVVSSSYSGEGFVPLAPGMGALRVNMPAMPGITDGSIVGNGGTTAANAFIFLPEPDFGLLQTMYVRYYLRIGTPYSTPFSQRYQVYHTSGGSPAWTDMAGKTGICPSHVTSYGGVSGTSGGGYGWQMRLSWEDCDIGLNGPYENGWACGLHTYDFQGHNPPGYNYSTEADGLRKFGTGGGTGGVFYAGQWYEIEMEMKCNAVSQTAPGYTPDGEIRVWVDGRLMFERTGMVVRSLPLYDPGYKAGYLRPARELGHSKLWFNWFHGGQTQSSIDRTVFITGLVWARQYIGPMKGL